MIDDLFGGLFDLGSGADSGADGVDLPDADKDSDGESDPDATPSGGSMAAGPSALEYVLVYAGLIVLVFFLQLLWEPELQVAGLISHLGL